MAKATRLDEARFVRADHRLHPITDAELVEDAADMGAIGLFGCEADDDNASKVEPTHTDLVGGESREAAADTTALPWRHSPRTMFRT